MIKKEISVGYAVKRLRDQIDGGIAPRIWKALSFAWRAFVFAVKFCIAWIIAAIVNLALGMNAALLVLFALLAWLFVPLLIMGLKYAAKRLKQKQGILLGRSYSRITEQYANTETDIHRGTNVVESFGEDCPYYIDYANEPNPHVLVVGSSTSGKTSTTKAFICRNYLEYGTHFLMIDWDGDNEVWASELGAALWKVPENFKINMFRLSGMNPEQRASMVEDALLIAGRMTMLQATKIKNIVLKAYFEGQEPTLQSLTEQLNRDGKRNSLIIYRLSAIWRVIGEEPEEFWGSIFKNNTVISLAGLNRSEKAVIAYFILQRICELFEKEDSGRKDKLLVVVDEAWQLLHSSERLGVQESLAERVVRVGRRYGFGIVTSTQQMDDVTQSFVNSSSLIFIHNYKQIQSARGSLAMNHFDLAYLAAAAPGECLVFDRLRSHSGQAWQDYVKVKKLVEGEYAQMKAKSSKFAVPVCMNTSETARPELPKTSHESATQRKSPFKIPEGAPSPAEHAAMLAIYYCIDRTKANLIGYIKDKGWIRSPTTLYGYTAKPGVLDGIVNAGFAAKSKEVYELTEQGLRWVDPEHILVNQSDKLGSEEHKRLLISTIHKLHESNMLVTTSSIKHSPDLIAWPVHEKKKYLWDNKGVKGYEIQTSARSDSVRQNSSKEGVWGVPIEWVYAN